MERVVRTNVSGPAGKHHPQPPANTLQSSGFDIDLS
jgi:hypothetical protein